MRSLRRFAPARQMGGAEQSMTETNASSGCLMLETAGSAPGLWS